MVFQNYALYPHYKVYDNIAYPLKLQKRPKPEIEQRVLETAKILGVERLLQRWPRQLSGGERQRVALGRAIVREPRLYLMDEPLSNLMKLRADAGDHPPAAHVGTTTIYGTHDQAEAMTMGMDHGNAGREGAADRQARDALQLPGNVFGAVYRQPGDESCPPPEASPQGTEPFEWAGSRFHLRYPFAPYLPNRIRRAEWGAGSAR
jgi:multiple sugar transport system ATP-binding protein